MTVDAEIRDRQRRWRTIAAVIALLAFTALGVAALVLPMDVGARVSGWIAQTASGPWAMPAAVLVFVALATLGTPQVVIVPALVVALGPWAGFFASWIGKVISCAVGFFVGRRLGARALARRASPALAAIMADLGRHGFWGSALVRLVPTVPSVVVNVAAGCTPMRFSAFIAGAAVGSVPKLALIAFAGYSVVSGLAGAGAHAWISLAGAVLLLAFIAWLGRRWLRRRLADQA